MRLRWAVFGVILLLVAGVTMAFVFANRLIEANRDRLLTAATEAIGRPVHVGGISARLLGRPGVRLSDVAIADDPAFGVEPIVSARGATVVVRLWPLLHGKLKISRIELEEPVVHVVRAADGRFNYASLGRAGGTAPAAPAPGLPVGPSAGLAWAVALFDIDDGAVDFVDRAASPPQTMAVRKIDLRASDIAFDQAIRFHLHAAADAPAENVALSGEVGPIASSDGIPFSLEGSLGPFGQTPARLENLVARGRARPQGVEVAELKFDAFGGEMSGQAAIPLVDRGPFTFRGTGIGVELQKLLPVAAPQLKQEIDGRAAIDANLEGVGRTPESLRSSMHGEVTLAIRDGVLRRYNLPGDVVRRLTSVPGLSQIIARGVKPKYAGVLSRPDTRFESLDLSLRVVPGGFDIDRFALVGEDFGATATGTMSQAGDADLKGEVQLSKRFSDDVAADVKEARLLFNAQGEIAIPFRYRGKVGQARPEADVERLATSLLGSRGGALVDQLQRALKGFFR